MVPERDRHTRHFNARQTLGDAARAVGDDRQFALIHDQHINQGQQLGRQDLRGGGIEHHLNPLGARRPGISSHRLHRYFKLQQQMRETLQGRQVGAT